MARNDVNFGQASTVSVRGHSAFNGPASRLSILGALVFDIALSLSLALILIDAFGLEPILKSRQFLLGLASLLTVFGMPQLLLRATLGQKAWGIAFVEGRIKQQQRMSTERTSLAMIFVAAALFAFGLTAHRTVLSHPLLMRATNWELDPYVPTAEDKNWAVLPFFYTVGAWPRFFEGQPVMYSLPYSKGPPEKFVGHIVAHWEIPDTRVTIEGPLTTTESNPYVLRECLIAPFHRAYSSVCLKLRQEVIAKHIREIRRIHPVKWELRWFEIKNLALAPHESPIGVYLRGTAERRTQERFIFINARGANQTFILDRPHTSRGELARKAFERIMRTQKLTVELAPGRAWVDRRLASTRLDELKNHAGTEQFIPKLAEIHSLLIAKISVEPRTFDAYFHLAGTSLMLARHASEKRNSDWTAIAKPLVQSSFRYAKDVAPGDPRIPQIENIWIDARKF